MLIQHKKIAIAGGGPGGLALARLLQQAGADTIVYERDAHKDARIQGGTLDLHDDAGLAALRKAGLLDEFKKYYRPGAEKMRITDKHANIIYDQHTEATTEDFGDAYFRPEIDRGPLRDVLLHSLRPGTVVYNRHVISLEKMDTGWKLFFQDGTTAMADIVIAADGANSKIRSYITGIQPVYAGITIVEGSVYHAAETVPGVDALLKGGKIFAMDDSKTLIVSSKGDGSLGFAIGIRIPEYWWKENGINFTDQQQALAWFKQTFPDWNDVWLELFDNGQTVFTLRPQYCMPLDQHWTTQSDITMIGDAAHWMPPYAGEGVNMAMLDALELSECLTSTSYANLPSAIAAFEKKMLDRFAIIGNITMEQTEALHSPGAIGHMMEMMGIEN